MRRLVLIGDEASKATVYIQKAAAELEYPLEFRPIPYGEAAERFDVRSLAGSLVKLDPPRFGTADIMELNCLIGSYEELLKKLEQAEGVELLNSPQSIRDTLNKSRCKEILSGTGVAVTPVLAADIDRIDTLKELMGEYRKYRVFIKPRYGSGAGGVLAYRINPRDGREVLYTSAWAEGQTLINTKKLRRFDDADTIRRIITGILSMGAIVEEWMPKAVYCGKAYDLRAVCQFGRIDYMVARQSAGPITNLHLNNDALDVSALKLPEDKKAEIERLCCRAMQHFPGLRVAGIDVLLTPEELKPYIIEINAQGDLIYQDIFHENRIYRAQINHFKMNMQEAADRRQE